MSSVAVPSSYIPTFCDVTLTDCANRQISILGLLGIKPSEALGWENPSSAKFIRERMACFYLVLLL